MASAVASKSSHSTLWPPGTTTCGSCRASARATGIHERSTEHDERRAIGHGGGCAAISLHATITAGRDHRQR